MTNGALVTPTPDQMNKVHETLIQNSEEVLPVMDGEHGLSIEWYF